MHRRHVLTAAQILAASPTLAQDTALPDLDGREVVIAVENAYPPLQYIKPSSGKAVGWEYDFMAALGDRLNFVPVYQATSWDAMIPAVAGGEYDMGMTGITIREDRAEVVDFSDPYMRSEMRMLVRGDEDRFETAGGFAADEDLLIGAQPGTTPFYVGIYEVLDGDEQNPRMRQFETFGAAVQALRVNDVDLVLTDSTAAEGYVTASEGGLKIVGARLGAEDFGFIFPKGSDLVAPIDKGIEALKVDGTVDELNQLWFVETKLGQ